MTLRKVRAYCFIALAIMLFCACQETEHIQLSDGEEVPVEVVMSARGEAITGLQGRDKIKSIRIVVFRHNTLPQLPNIPSWTCEFNGRIDNFDEGGSDTPVNTATTDPGDNLTYENGVFSLGNISIGEKRIYVIANEDSYYGEGTFTSITKFEDFVATATATEKELISGLTLTPSPSEATALAEPNANDDSFLMSGSIATVVSTAGLPDGKPFTVPSIELVRACARVKADIIGDTGLDEVWKVTKVEVTNCTNKVSLFGGTFADTKTYFTDADNINRKIYLHNTEITIPTASDEDGNANEAISLFDDIYVYENIVSTADALGSATKIILTLTKTDATTKTATIYIGNDATSVQAVEPPVPSSLLSIPSRAETNTDDYSVYRNYYYQLAITVKKQQVDPVTTSTVSSTTILPRGTSSDDIQLDVTVTRVEEK